MFRLLHLAIIGMKGRACKMKKILLTILIVSVLALAGCGEATGSGKPDLRPMLMVEDEIYLDTGEEMPVEIDPSAIIGKITSSVEQGEMPTENGQSNFGCIDSEYAYYDDGLAVMINNEWYRFEKEE